MKVSVYLIGATVFITKLNIQSFEAVENAFSKHGFEVVKPHDLFTEQEQRELTDDQQIKRRLNALANCDLALLIPGWDEDSFACAERSFANFRHIPLHSLLEGINAITQSHKKRP